MKFFDDFFNSNLRTLFWLQNEKDDKLLTKNIKLEREII